MNVAVIIQARMTSTRLPGKVLAKVCGKSLLEHLIDRLGKVKRIDGIMVAATVNATDDPIVELCRELDVSVFRGSEDDVLSRYYHAAAGIGAEIIVRVTSDCPLLDPTLADEIIGHYLDHREELDYVCEARFPQGLSVEVFPFRILEEIHREATAQPDREHVTTFIIQRPERYRLGYISADSDLSHHRWTVDTPADLELVTRILGTLLPDNHDYTMDDVLRLMDEHPDWYRINAHVRQKEYGE